MSDYTSPLDPQEDSASEASPQRPLLMVGIVGGLVILVLLCVAVIVVSMSRSRSGITTGRATATPVQGTPVPPGVIQGAGGSVPLTQTAPSAIEFADHTFDVIPVEVAQGAWPYQSGHPDKVVWVFGTLINYVIGVEANQDNTNLVGGLKEGDTVQLITYGGKTLTFQYSGRQWVSPDSTDIFRQMRPGLTLVLLGDHDQQNDRRLVVSTSYVSENEASSGGEVTASVGTPVNVSGARVTVLDGRLLQGVADLPSGSADYVVDFSVTAVGTSPLDASLFQMQLMDASGQRYELSVPASQVGDYGPPGGQLLPDTTLTATAGFVVPESLPGTSVIWSFSPQAGGSAPARFILPVGGTPPTPQPRAQTVVKVTGARYSNDATEVIISGGVGNTSQEPISVSLSDINLQAGGTLVPVVSSDPELPWMLQPGQTLAFTINFTRPPAGTAIFSLLQSSFELSGLQ